MSPMSSTLESTFGVFIGRFQPPHETHVAVMLEGLQRVQKLIVVIGSARSARSIKNPFTAEERERLIADSLEAAGVNRNRFAFVQVRDYFYNEAMWLAEVQGGVHAITKGSTDISLLGHVKDGSSYYLKSFPNWQFSPTSIVSSRNATAVREALWRGETTTALEAVSPAVRDFLETFVTTPEYADLRAEFEYVQEYKRQWSTAPYPPVFVTTDAVVMKSGFVLVVKRGDHPGKGRLALPGGFLNQKETLLQGCLRELREETGFKVDWEKHLRSSQVFDYPDRSVRGRTVTHAFHFDLGLGSLPEVKGADDATDAFWMPLSETLAKPELFFEDHHAILEHFVMRQ
ncbi:MAG: bifunctional nicotinamide-nucleotide adenylyltransferase/Nudix hydroxylase [Pleurocapsa sp. SU_196_0]|nr:bifunctional nicotinamide-nucleotide adenylyltransferase/Nudix hydroxylase [Pleurocapsa sp. SU_196_0]